MNINLDLPVLQWVARNRKIRGMRSARRSRRTPTNSSSSRDAGLPTAVGNRILILTDTDA